MHTIVPRTAMVAKVATLTAIFIPALGSLVFAVALGRSLERERASAARAEALLSILIEERIEHSVDHTLWAEREQHLISKVRPAPAVATAAPVRPSKVSPRRASRAKKIEPKTSAFVDVQKKCGDTHDPLCGLDFEKR